MLFAGHNGEKHDNVLASGNRGAISGGARCLHEIPARRCSLTALPGSVRSRLLVSNRRALPTAKLPDRRGARSRIFAVVAVALAAAVALVAAGVGAPGPRAALGLPAAGDRPG